MLHEGTSGRMATLSYPHIEVTADGVPVIAGTRTKVVEVVLDHLAHDWDAREIHRQHPHLSMSQIYAALTYYYDHQPEIDADIERRVARVDEIRSSLGPSPLRAKLKQLGRLP